MTNLEPPLNKEDFINSPWQEVVNGREKKDCLTYGSHFLKKAEEAEIAGNLRQKVMFQILAKINFSPINPATNEEFFAEKFQELTEEVLGFLDEIAGEISDAELQARVADILWSRKRKYQMAQLAVDAYLTSAIELEHPEDWTYCYERIERALRLACKIKYQPEKVVTHIEEVLERYNGEDPLWLSAKLMQLLQEHKLGNPTQYANIAEKAATLAESKEDWDRARCYWEIKAKWHQLEKDEEKQRAASLKAAETYVKEAEYAFNQSSPSYPGASVASGLMGQAMEALRGIKGTKKRAEEVHHFLLQYQQESKKELVSIYSDSVEFTQEIEKSIAWVKGKDLPDALFSLALLFQPPKISQLRELVQKIDRDYVAFHLFSKSIINERGKIVARKPISDLDYDLETAESATQFEMYQTAILHQKIYAEVCIEPARNQIILEHSVRVNDLVTLVKNSPFVPPDREFMFAKGLYAGLTGDFITSTHILIPQIENSMRYVLGKHGVITSGFDDHGIQKEHNLNSTLYRPEIAGLFDEDTLFDLKGLLVEHSGSNLRNRMAHGLINDQGFLSPIMSYLWWITLRLCCLTIVYNQREIQQSDPWLQFAGMFEDDPLFDEFVEDMAAYRRELDAEMSAEEVGPEESRSA